MLPMITVQNLGIAFGGTTLFEGVSFQIKPGDRIGLIGKNGAGKTTLMRALYGEITPDAGSVSLKKGLKIGVLEQDISFKNDKSVVEEAYTAFEEIKSIEQTLTTVNTELSERTDYESESYRELIVQMTELTQRLELIGGYSYEGEAERVLKGLGFKTDDLQKKTSTFSGGWRMRVELAKLLLQKNDVLLLDEPTNHLDIESIIWMEDYLQQFPGAVVLVSHDRMFLDKVTNRTIEISFGQIYDLNMPFSTYQVHREEQRELQRNAQKNQQREIQRAERLINKFRAKSTKAAMAQSLIKKLDKMERIEVDEVDSRVMNLRFPPCPRSGKVVLEVDGVSKSYGDKVVLQDINLHIDRGDKIAFVGQNGQGKTTLAKILVGQLDHKGLVSPGYQVKIGYFAQDQTDTLHEEDTVQDTLMQVADEKTRPRVRDILGAFMFGGDAVDKKVKVLSGGERNRLALAQMLVQPFNVLVMDEPTNHLDMPSKNVLKKALKDFDGTLIVVSHDRDFLKGLSEKVYEFREAKIVEYLGDITYFLAEKNAENFREIELGDQRKPQSEHIADSKKHHRDKKATALEKSLSRLEKEIALLEAEISAMEANLSTSEGFEKREATFFREYKVKKDTLDTLMEKWENTSESLDKLR